MIERRSIIKGLVALVAAPAIIKVGSIMPINSGLVPQRTWRIRLPNDYVVTDGPSLSVQDVTERWAEYDGVSMRLIDDYKPGDETPLDVLHGSTDKSLHYQAQLVTDREFWIGEQWSDADIARLKARQHAINAQHLIAAIPKIYDTSPVEQAVGPLALAAAAVAVAPAILEKPVTRRFWSK